MPKTTVTLCSKLLGEMLVVDIGKNKYHVFKDTHTFSDGTVKEEYFVYKVIAERISAPPITERVIDEAESLAIVMLTKELFR